MGSEPGATRAGKRTWALLVLAVVDAPLGVAHAFCSPQDVSNGPLEIIGGGWQDLLRTARVRFTAWHYAVHKLMTASKGEAHSWYWQPLSPSLP